VTAPAIAAVGQRSRWPRAATLLVPAVLAWLAANTLYWAAADRQGFDYLLVRTHARWDSGNYLNIARHGYTLAHCVPRPASPFTSVDWCGTVGWFPLNPLGMRLLAALSLTAPRAGLLLAELFTLGSLGLLWWLLEASPHRADLACLALAAVFPGSVYEHALFPVSLAVAASLAFLALAACERWTAAGIAGAASAAAYQTGVLLAAVGPIWLLLARRRLGLNRAATFGRAVQTGALVVVGLLAVMSLQQAETGLAGAAGRRRPPGPVPGARPADPLGPPAAPPPGGRPSRPGAARRGGRLADGRPLLPLRADLMAATCARKRTVLPGTVGSGTLPGLR
jgi:hypothetical protein